MPLFLYVVPVGGLGGSNPSQRLKETDNTTQEQTTGVLCPLFSAWNVPRVLCPHGDGNDNGRIIPVWG